MTAPLTRSRVCVAAFTVTELLVSLAVLAVVMVLSLAAIRTVTMQTRQVASATTMKGIGRALALYVNDHGELPGPSHNKNPPYFMRGNKIISHIWPYLGRSERPQDDEVMPEYVPAHWIKWLRANHLLDPVPQTKPMIYWLSTAYVHRGESYTLWGYPGGGSNKKVRWTTLTTVCKPSQVVAVRDTQPGDNPSDYPAFGELQNYTTRLYFDWHVEIHKP